MRSFWACAARRLSGAFVLAGALVSLPAAARQAPDEPSPSGTPPAGEPGPADATAEDVALPRKARKQTLVHRHQAAIGMMPGIGYRVIIPYEENKICGDRTGDDAKRVCTNTLPLFLDIQAAFGVTERLDVITDVRVGLVADFTRNRQIALAPGIRYWVDSQNPLKFFATAQLVWDGTDQNGQVKRDDFALRNANGLQYDFMRNFGLFLQFGETLGFRRWLRFELDGGAGVQARFP